jgi:uncharacterized protein YqeY
MQEQIQKDFIQAMKDRNPTAKAALSSLKSALKTETIAKKRDLNEAEQIKVIAKAVKQREQSQKEFEKGDRPELALQEQKEADVLRAYLPVQMNEADIRANLKKIMDSLTMPNPKALSGKTMGDFNKNFPGAADMSVVKRIVDELAAECA